MGCTSTKVVRIKPEEDGIDKPSTSKQSENKAKDAQKAPALKVGETTTKVEPFSKPKEKIEIPKPSKQGSTPSKLPENNAEVKAEISTEIKKEINNDIKPKNATEVKANAVTEQPPNLASTTKEDPSKEEPELPTSKQILPGGTEEIRKTEIDVKLSRIYSPTRFEKPQEKLRILHFNDVYNIESRDQEPVGGAARFVTKVRSFPDEPLILFSGDCLNPSLINEQLRKKWEYCKKYQLKTITANVSTMTKGKQMLPVLEAIGVHAACYGNHDFDFGVDELIEFKRKTSFPWLLSNVEDKLSKSLLAEGVEKIVCEWHGRKIGIMGLVEKEWLVTLAALDPDDIEYKDFISAAREITQDLRENHGCEFIIALSHMRVPNDTKLLECDIDIDLILGGHDHHYEVKQHNNKTLVKSGTDFRELTEIIIDFSADSKERKITTQKHEVTVDVLEDEETKKECDKYSLVLGQKMEEELGLMHVALDGRFSTVRTKESNLGNFICDIMRAATQTDIALLNSGSLRSDTIHPAGPFKMKDLVSILPMVDTLVVLKMTGKVILESLENSVSQYPKFEGRFLQVSGIRFAFDPEKPPGERICRETVMVHDNIPINLEYEYSVVTKEYVANGKDGFDMMPKCPVIVDAENGQVLLSIVENHFESIRIYKGKRKSISGHRQSITVKRDEQQTFMEKQRSRLSPEIEGRIRLVGEPEKLSPTFVRRKSKLRRTVLNADVEQRPMGVIKEGGDVEGNKAELVEEVEASDDSDIESVMMEDNTREQINEEDRMNMWEACRTDNVDKLTEIVNGRQLDWKFWIMEKTILHHSAQNNAVKCLDYILKESNLKVDVRDQILKGTALYYASEHGSKEAALLLLDRGAKVNSRNSLWETPLHVACENGQGSLIIILLSRGADRTIRNKEGQRPKY